MTTITTREELNQVFLGIAARQFSGHWKVDIHETFQSQGVDSLDVYEIVMEIEQEFDIAVTDEIIAISTTPVELIENVFKIILDIEEKQNAHRQ